MIDESNKHKLVKSLREFADILEQENIQNGNVSLDNMIEETKTQTLLIGKRIWIHITYAEPKILYEARIPDHVQAKGHRP